MTAETAIKRQEGQITRPERTRDRWTYTPNVDIIEKEDELLVLADMPGVEAKDVDVQYEQGLLSIHGRVEPRHDDAGTSYLLQEYGVGDYERTFQIGEGIDAEKIDAGLRNGVLELHLPKTQAFKPRRITVKGS